MTSNINTASTDTTTTAAAADDNVIDATSPEGLEASIDEINICDSDGNPIDAETAKKILESIMNGEAEIVGDNDDEEELPPFELPEMYRDKGDRESLSETSAYSEHLNEHWGF